MKLSGKLTVVSILIVLVALFISLDPVSAQMSTYPWFFGTTSVSNYAGVPYTMNYINRARPYYGTTFAGGVYPAWGEVGFVSSVKSAIPGVSMIPATNVMNMLQYYQYLLYAYQFYQIARVTPYFYSNDIIADYIGSSLYSYGNLNNLGPQEAIIGFIQQNLL